MTFSAFFEPSIPLDKAVRFVGLEPVAGDTFLAIRCKEPPLGLLDPKLAKWPEVFAAIEQDFGSKYACPLGRRIQRTSCCVWRGSFTMCR